MTALVYLFLQVSPLTSGGSDPNYGLAYRRLGSRFKADFYVQNFKGPQWVPMIGIGCELRLFWRIYAIGQLNWSWGFKPYQKLFVEYSIDGVQQPIAEWQGNGTAFMKTLGVGIKLWDWKYERDLKKKRHKKGKWWQ